MERSRYILTLTCRDDFGIVATVTGCLFSLGAFIIESSQFGDATTERFFMRVVFSVEKNIEERWLSEKLKAETERFSMSMRLKPSERKPKTLILVSKESHCLNDILHRAFAHTLHIEVMGVVSNHLKLKPMAEWYNVPFHYIPISEESKARAEEDLRAVINSNSIDLVVLARYMQILSPKLCEELKGRAINIHHSFLPSFKGARPYHQAFDRGVKVVGATAHYVTPELDEGPIIDQETIRVSHDHSPERLVAMGRDVECSVLSRAIALHAESRVLLNGYKTVVFN